VEARLRPLRVGSLCGKSLFSAKHGGAANSWITYNKTIKYQFISMSAIYSANYVPRIDPRAGVTPKDWFRWLYMRKPGGIDEEEG
jgi:hypothetical protein